MKLRNFLYLNTKVVEDYIAAIDGYTYDEETQAVATSSEDALTGKGALGIASGSGSHTGKQSEEIKRSVRISDAAKFEKVHKYLRSDEDDGLKYFEFLTDEDYNSFYKEKFMDFTDPVAHIHAKTEGTATYNALLYIPSKAPYD
ncbi:MAG: hypothetical protein IKM30_00735, partial [Oscillospiraceae bacterium]|nr:hypothetical protein [Oscillospiraceae bacterium]